MRLICWLAAFVPLFAAVFGSIRGIVHDPDHRPVVGAQVVVKAKTSDFSQTLTTGADGAFETSPVPVGVYEVTVTREGFTPSVQDIVVASGSAPVLHVPLAIGTVKEAVTVSESALAVNPEQMTPTSTLGNPDAPRRRFEQ